MIFLSMAPLSIWKVLLPASLEVWAIPEILLAGTFSARRGMVVPMEILELRLLAPPIVQLTLPGNYTKSDGKIEVVRLLEANPI